MKKYKLGEWDLKELVKDPKNPDFEKQIKHVQTMAKNFEKNKKTLESKITSKRFLKILHSLEELAKKISILGGYSSLAYAADTQSDEATSLMTRMTKLGANISNQILFFDLWWKREIDEKNAQRLIKHSGELSGYLRHKRLVAKYSLTEPDGLI